MSPLVTILSAALRNTFLNKIEDYNQGVVTNWGLYSSGAYKIKNKTCDDLNQAIQFICPSISNRCRPGSQKSESFLLSKGIKYNLVTNRGSLLSISGMVVGVAYNLVISLKQKSVS